jgi:Pro-kumamolisin, activation domain/Fibronectin type III domain
MFQQLKKAIRRAFLRRIGSVVTLFSAAVCSGLLSASVGASGQPQSASASRPASLPGHIHMFARSRFDAGEAPSSLRMGGLELLIAKTPAQQQALDSLVADQQNPKSPQYHRWLTPSEYGSRFGASDATIVALSNWLKSNGLQVGNVPAGRGHLPFTGSKAQAEAAFHLQIHLFNVDGEGHYANVSDPMIPADLKPMIAAIRGLHDFNPKPGVKPMNRVPRSMLPTLAGHDARASASPDTFYSGSNQYPGYVGPTDFATIYNLLPAYQQGITGAGVTVGIAAQSDVKSSVLSTFWAAFAVAGSNFGLPDQLFSSMPVPAADGGADPGETMDGNEDEAYLDTEIVGALAPGARLVLVRDKVATTAAQYIIDQNLAAVLNLSFGQCEAAEAAANTTVNAMWQQAASEGITVTVSTGDAGVAACTAPADIGKTDDVNSHGFAVNGLASTPYDLAVGGTDFDPRMEAQYWSSGNQQGTLASATSHIPEIVWNDSCANPILADAYQVFDPIVFCNTSKLPGGNTANPFIEILGGGGGLSSCTATDSSGHCTGGYAQPSWQAGYGIGNFGARALPDVSMIATRWLMCSYDTAPCDPTKPPSFPPAAPGTIKVLEGTSASAPSVAAIIAMLDQTQITPAVKDGRQGLVNPLFYQLASPEYQNPAIESQCNASQGSLTLSLCIFFDVTAGSNAQPCSVANYSANSAGSLPASTCVSGSGDATGIMEVNGMQDYGTFLGFDIATGLGSINAATLIAAVQSSTAPSGLAASTSGQTVTLTWTADPQATVGYDIYEGMTLGRPFTLIQQDVTGTSAVISGLQFGKSYLFAIEAVSSTAVSPLSSSVEATIVPAAPTGLMVSAAGAGSLSLSWTASSGAGTYNIYEGTTPGGEGVTPYLTGWTKTSVTFQQLTAGQQYFFTVVALDPGGASAPSAEASGTLPPAAPTGLSATAGNGTASLAWSAATGASSYNVYEGTSPGGESTVPVQTGLTGLSASVAGLQNGTNYFFYVAAVNGGGTSASSNQVNVTPTAPAGGGGGGGGSMDWLALGLLALLVSSRTALRYWDHGAGSAG